MKEKVSIISIIVNAILTFGKVSVGILTGSALVLAEGLHSLSDVFASAISYAGIKISKRPGDKAHPYGYYKFEVLSGLIITIILFSAGLSAIYEAYKGFIEPEKLNFSAIAFAVMIVAAIINEIMARIKINYGKKENSISLISDGMHSRVDVYASIGVVGGLVLAQYWAYADATFAFLIGLYIIKESLMLGREAIDSLLDVSAGEAVEGEIRSVLESLDIKFSSIKTQKKGTIITANLEILLPDDLDINQANKISESLKEKLISKIDNLRYIAIQIKSLGIENGFYKPAFGQGFGWQRKAKYEGKIKNASGKGPDGSCICPKCDYKTLHEKGHPCSDQKCPECGSTLERD